MLGGDRDRLAEPERERLQHAGLAVAALALVGDDDGVASGAARQLGEGAVRRRQPGAGVDHEQQDIGFGDGGLGLGPHAALEALGLGLFKAGRVDDAEFEMAEPAVALAAVAGDAGAVVDQRQALADEAVEERRLADIRTADNGDGEGHG